LAAISSSPVLVGNRIYQTDKTGHLCCVDADTGKVLWRHKLAPDQLHASPLYADGKLYVPMQNGSFYILRPTGDGRSATRQGSTGRALYRSAVGVERQGLRLQHGKVVLLR
jgi:outer membrane protein assembly factor BamB